MDAILFRGCTRRFAVVVFALALLALGGIPVAAAAAPVAADASASSPASMYPACYGYGTPGSLAMWKGTGTLGSATGASYNLSTSGLVLTGNLTLVNNKPGNINPEDLNMINPSPSLVFPLLPAAAIRL